jgi:hypothetical protein
MGKTLEHDSRWPDWLNGFLNRIAVDVETISAWSRAWGPWGCHRAGRSSVYWVLDGGGRSVLPQMHSQVWNARVFLRVVFVQGWPAGFTLSGRPAGANYKHTLILGYKVNGRFALTLRLWHTDQASAAGTSGPNYGQVVGDEFGPA